MFHWKRITTEFTVLGISSLGHRLLLSIFRRIKNVINQFEVNMDVELQQRGVEFGSLFKNHDSMRWVFFVSSIFKLFLQIWKPQMHHHHVPLGPVVRRWTMLVKSLSNGFISGSKTNCPIPWIALPILWTTGWDSSLWGQDSSDLYPVGRNGYQS